MLLYILILFVLITVFFSFILFCFVFFFFFFFSSRRRHTRCSRDWSSDVCSSDLAGAAAARQRPDRRGARSRRALCPRLFRPVPPGTTAARSSRRPRTTRSEERRVGKECRSRWSPDH